MKEKTSEVGLNALYQISEKAQTGTCAVLITGNDRHVFFICIFALSFFLTPRKNKQKIFDIYFSILN